MSFESEGGEFRLVCDPKSLLCEWGACWGERRQPGTGAVHLGCWSCSSASLISCLHPPSAFALPGSCTADLFGMQLDWSPALIGGELLLMCAACPPPALAGQKSTWRSPEDNRSLFSHSFCFLGGFQFHNPNAESSCGW